MSVCVVLLCCVDVLYGDMVCGVACCVVWCVMVLSCVCVSFVWWFRLSSCVLCWFVWYDGVGMLCCGGLCGVAIGCVLC